MAKKTAADLLDDAIADLEARLNLAPGQDINNTKGNKANNNKKNNNNNNKGGGGGNNKNNKKNDNKNNDNNNKNQAPNQDQPDICKLEFKVGQITKVWVHETADKLYCEEINVGEETPRQIASGLRPHFTIEQMMGQRLLVVSNLKAKNLVGFKSHGMVLCAAEPIEGGDGEKVEFVEPPADAKIGEVISFEGLPPPEPFSASQVEKKKVFAACLEGMKTTADGLAAWNGHVFVTSAGPCKAKTIKGGVMR